MPREDHGDHDRRHQSGQSRDDQSADQFVDRAKAPLVAKCDGHEHAVVGPAGHTGRDQDSDQRRSPLAADMQLVVVPAADVVLLGEFRVIDPGPAVVDSLPRLEPLDHVTAAIGEDHDQARVLSLLPNQRDQLLAVVVCRAPQDAHDLDTEGVARGTQLGAIDVVAVAAEERKKYCRGDEQHDQHDAGESGEEPDSVSAAQGHQSDRNADVSTSL